MCIRDSSYELRPRVVIGGVVAVVYQEPHARGGAATEGGSVGQSPEHPSPRVGDEGRVEGAQLVQRRRIERAGGERAQADRRDAGRRRRGGGGGAGGGAGAERLPEHGRPAKPLLLSSMSVDDAAEAAAAHELPARDSAHRPTTRMRIDRRRQQRPPRTAANSSAHVCLLPREQCADEVAKSLPRLVGCLLYTSPSPRDS